MQSAAKPLSQVSSLQKTALGAFGGLFLAWEGQGLFFWFAWIGALLYGLRARDLLLPAVLLTSFVYGTWRFVPPHALEKIPWGKRVKIQALVYRPPLRLRGYTRLEVEIKRILDPPQEPHLKARLYAPAHISLRVGDVFEGLVRLKRPRGFWNPFAYETSKALATRGIYVVGHLLSRPPPEVLYRALGFPLQRLRAKLFAFAHRLPPEARGLFEALILGEKLALMPTWRNTFHRLGLAHLLAISGLHLALLSSMAFLVLRLLVRFSPVLLLYKPERTWGLWGALALGGLYVVISGPSASALRAYVMLLVFALAHFLGRESRPLDNLALAVLIILFFWPKAIGSLSFRLSVVAVLGLIMAAKYKTQKWSWPVELFYFSTAALFFTAPLSLLAFGSFSPMAPFTNVVALPLFAFFVLPLEFLCAGLAFLEPLWAAKMASWPALILRPFLQLKGLCLVPPLPVGIFLLAAVPLFGMLLSKSYRYFWLGLVVLLETLAYFLYQPLVLISVLDVGQGSAAIAKIGPRLVLFDAGPQRGDFNAGAWVLAPTLRKMGLKQIEVLVVSHPQMDHLGGLWGLAAQGYLPEKILVGSFVEQGLYQRLIKDFGPKVERLTVPKSFSWPRASLSLFPGKTHSPLPQANREGLLARLCLKEGLCILFPGDIDEPREKRLLAQGVSLKSDILILAHHGSRTSNSRAFLAAVAPRQAFCSARSRFHPSSILRARLAHLGIPLLCTKEKGALTLLVKQGKIWVCTEESRRHYPWPINWLWPLWPVGCKVLQTSTTH